MTLTNGALGIVEDGDEGDNHFPEINATNRALTAFLGTIKVLDKDLATPPGAPSHGDAYIIATGGTGAWSTHDKKIARYNTYDAANTWDIYPVREGMFAWVADEDKLYYYTGTAWAEFAQGGGASALNDLSDVDTSGQVDGDVLTRVAGVWVPQTPAVGDDGILFDSTLGGTATSIDTGANGIAGGYDVLEVLMLLRTDQAAALSTITVTLNNDTGANYDRQFVQGSNTTASAGEGSGEAGWSLGCTGASAASGNFAVLHFTFPFYDQTTAHKTGVGVDGNADTTTTNRRARTYALRWRNTAAITRLTVTAPGGSNFIAGSRLMILGRPVAGGGAGGSTEGQDTAAGTIYVATTGNDTTGDGSSGAPYATVGKALSVLPRSLGFVQTIDVADGTYAEAITVDDFNCTGAGKILVTGNTTTPANVSFTGTVSNTYQNTTVSATVTARGPVVLEIEGIRVNATANAALFADGGSHVIVDRSTLTGTLSYGAFVSNATVEFKGNCTVSGFTTDGVFGAEGAKIRYTSAGTLTITGPGTSGNGVHLVNGCQFPIYNGLAGTGLNITITGVKYGFQMGFNCSFTHQGGSSTITIDNATTPASSAAVNLTDHSNWSTNQTVVLDNFTNGFELNSISYAEATGTRTFTNLGSTSSVTQNSVYYAP